jgi:hypothetical protein
VSTLLLLYCCFTAALLLLYCNVRYRVHKRGLRFSTGRACLLYCCFTAALLLIYCCFTAAVLLIYCCFTAALLLQVVRAMLDKRPELVDMRADMDETPLHKARML